MSNGEPIEGFGKFNNYDLKFVFVVFLARVMIAGIRMMRRIMNAV